MKEEAVEIPTVDGTADGFLYVDEKNRGPGFLFLTDIGGIRPSQREMAREWPARDIRCCYRTYFIAPTRRRCSNHR
jgi:dienelactone hydrolase